MSYLRYLCLFEYSGVQHILSCVFGLFVFVLCLVYPVSCVPCVASFSVVQFLLPLRYSLYLKIAHLKIVTEITTRNSVCV